MIAIAGGKGGCGKTTTVAALARALATTGRTPLAVDADVDMPNLHHVAGVPAEPGLPALSRGASPGSAATSAPGLPGVEVLPAGTTPTDGAPSGLARAATFDGPVLVDTAAGASETVAAPLRHARATILVSTPDQESLEDTAKTAAIARTLDAPPVHTVLTRSDGSVNPRQLLGCEAVSHVPAVEDPLCDESASTVYRSIARRVSKHNS
jgi:septum site-determining protein MinD